MPPNVNLATSPDGHKKTLAQLTFFYYQSKGPLYRKKEREKVKVERRRKEKWKIKGKKRQRKVKRMGLIRMRIIADGRKDREKEMGLIKETCSNIEG